MRDFDSRSLAVGPPTVGDLVGWRFGRGGYEPCWVLKLQLRCFSDAVHPQTSCSSALIEILSTAVGQILNEDVFLITWSLRGFQQSKDISLVQ